MSHPVDKQCEVTKMETSSDPSKDMFDAIDGFDDEDLEKPNFGKKHSTAKVPLILSDPDEVPRAQVPATINQYLRKYQQEGIAFLYKQYSVGKGAILADDMGLGKTVQVIGFISAVLGKTGTKYDVYGKFLKKSDNDKVVMSNIKKEQGAFLIVSPHSVLYNWHDELMTWGHFKIGKFHQNKRVETLERAAMGKLDVVLTTYETLRNHRESLNTIKWLAVIMDEVHHLKDPKTAVTKAAKSLKVKCRIGLSGTPLQNRLVDFWCILDWANPGCLGGKEDFANRFGKPILQGQRFDVNKRELATGRKKTQEFQSLIDEWCLRRTKALISDQLPNKDQKVVFCPLSKLQEDIYKTLLQTSDVEIVLRQGEPCDCKSGLTRGICCYFENEEGLSVKQLMLHYLKLFLKVANHAALLLPQVKQTEQQKKRATAICEKVFSIHPAFEVASKSPSFELFSDSNFCGKMKVLDQLLKLFKQQKDKVLLFSYSTQLLEMLEAYVISCGMVYRRLDGKTRGERRLLTVREFNTNPDIFLFLVSTKAGGVGLNLTGANVVIVFDPSWNPANDLQAEDRAYRIGQRRDVKVYRMISSGTVEENMYLRQIYKQQLANVAVEGNNERRYFTAVDGEKDKKGELFGIENLFALRNDGCSVTTDIFKRSDKIERGFKMTKYELEPEHKELEDKSTSTRASKESDEDEEDESYDLNEVASQLIGDESIEDEIGSSNNNGDMGEKNNEETSSIDDDDNNSTTESCPDNLENIKSEKQTKKVSEIRNVSEKNKLHNKISLLPRRDAEWKRRKSSKDSSTLKNTPMSKDSQVNQIFVDCGVQHTHSNKFRIGTSKAEKEMTSRAMKEVFELGQFSQQPANCFEAIESDSEESDDIGDCSKETVSTETDADKETDAGKDADKSDGSICSATKRVQKEMSLTKVGNCSVLFGETPRAIRLRQFMEMSQGQGYQSAVDLAKAVVGCNTTDRLNLLKGFYKTKDYPVQDILHFSQEDVQSSSEKKNTDNLEKTKRQKHLKSESSLKLSRARRRTSSKSYTKILKASAVKTNEKGGIGKSKCTIKNLTLASSSSLRNSIGKSENVKDGLQGGSSTGILDENPRKTKSSSAETKQVCTNIPPGVIEKIESEGNVIKSRDRLDEAPDANDVFTNSSTEKKCDKYRHESVLDEFLCEASQTASRMLNTDESSENVQHRFVVKYSHRELQKQASILDDLI